MPKAGPDKQLCGAQRPNQPKGVTCTQRAGWGTDHPGIGKCKRHGGATHTHIAAAEEQLARQECVRLGIPIRMNAAEAMVQEIEEAAGNVAFYRSLVAELPTHPTPDLFVVDENDPEDNGHWERGAPGVYGPTYHQSGVPTGEAKAHILVSLYGAPGRESRNPGTQGGQHERCRPDRTLSA